MERASVLGVLVAVVLLAGCGEDGLEEAVVDLDSYIALDSLGDVVTWADTVAVVTVVSEEQAPGAEDTGDEPLLGRRVVVRVEDVVWSRPGTEQPPATFETQAPGWVRDDDGGLTPMRDRSGIRVEVGGTYLAPIVFIDGWGFDAALGVEDGVVVAAPQQDTTWAQVLDGRTVEEAAEVLATAEPDEESGPLRGTTQEQLEAIGVDVG